MSIVLSRIKHQLKTIILSHPLHSVRPTQERPSCLSSICPRLPSSSTKTMAACLLRLSTQAQLKHQAGSISPLIQIHHKHWERLPTCRRSAKKELSLPRSVAAKAFLLPPIQSFQTLKLSPLIKRIGWFQSTRNSHRQ